MAAENPERIMFEEQFRQMECVDIPVQWRSSAKKMKFSIDATRKLSKCPQWAFNCSPYSDDCRFVAHISGWQISAPKGCDVWFVFQNMHSRKVHLTLTVKALGESGSSSKVVLGITQRVHSQNKYLLLKEAIISSGETVTIDVVHFFESSVLPIRFFPKISIVGDVVLENMKIGELPDDLAEAGVSVVEGTIKARSALPDPKKSAYPDCRLPFISKAIPSLAVPLVRKRFKLSRRDFRITKQCFLLHCATETRSVA